MFTNTAARRATLLFLFLALALAGTVGPASAMPIPPPNPVDNPDAGGTDVAVSSGTGPLPWVLIGLAVVLVAAGAMIALRRHGRTHRAALTSS
jgi:hypothetical protein